MLKTPINNTSYTYFLLMVLKILLDNMLVVPTVLFVLKSSIIELGSLIIINTGAKYVPTNFLLLARGF